MPSYIFPDIIVCLGIDGINVGKKFISEDWILEELVKTDHRSKGPSNLDEASQLDVFFIDASNDHFPTQEWIGNNVDQTIQKYQDTKFELSGELNIETINIKSGKQDDITHIDSEGSHEKIKELAEKLDLDAWWIDKSDTIVKSINEDPDKRSDNNRSVVKALSKIREASDDPLDRLINTVATKRDPYVAMVVNPAKGVGSGLLIDLAFRIVQMGADIDLFSILPDPVECKNGNLGANLYATLSELEYLTLTKRIPFNKIILLPHNSSTNSEYYEKSVCYTITSYYNISGNPSNFRRYWDSEQPHGPPAFAPFIIGTTRYLHYTENNIESDRLEDIYNSGDFRIDAMPYDRGRLGGSSNLSETNLWRQKREKRKILSKLDDIVPNLGGEYLPVEERYIEDGDTKEIDYDYHTIHSVFSSTLFEEFTDKWNVDIECIKDHFTDLPSLATSTGSGNYTSTRTTFADSYDIAMTTFLDGVFLDNLEVFSEPCRKMYSKKDNINKKDNTNYHHQSSVPNQVKFHTYGIDGDLYHDNGDFLPEESDAGFVYRDEILNFDDDGAKKLLNKGKENNNSWDEEVRNMILEEYHTHVGYPSTINLN